MTAVRIRQSLVLNEYFELSQEGLNSIVAAYRQAWKKKGEGIIDGLEKVTGLNYAQNIIDVYVIIHYLKDVIGNPIIISGRYLPEEFVQVLTHILIHRLVSDNRQHENWHIRAQKLYPRKDIDVANHIMTNAILEALYVDVMGNTDKVIWSIKHYEIFKKREAHKQAWDFINQYGQQDVVASLKAGKRVRLKQPA